MKAKDVAEKLLEHPDANVCGLGIHNNANMDDHVIWNGYNWWIGK